MEESLLREPRHLSEQSEQQRALLLAGLRHHTPLAQRLMLRHTRRLVRRYAERGLLKERVPKRQPWSIWIEMTPAEQAPYDRIESYIADFYARYEAERRGLGFVMTINRRLTSSFAAVRLSLQRRLEYLRKKRPDLGLTKQDLEVAELEQDVSETLTEALEQVYREEAVYLEGFIRDLEQLGEDSKLKQQQECLGELFRKYETVAVFTQYVDTMEELRERLRIEYGSQVVCYSGRGGEVWRDGSWQAVEKETIKNAFRTGQVKLLICTDAASEG